MRTIRFFHIFFVIFAFLFMPLFAENRAEEGKEDAVKDFVISSFHYESQYFGFPISFSLGYFYRKNDTSIFPSLAASFNVDSFVHLDMRGGFVFRHKFFSFSSYAVYDILPFTANKTMDEQILYNESLFSFEVQGLTLYFPFCIGRKRRLLCLEETENEPKSVTVNEVSFGAALNFFLIDTGFFKASGETSVIFKDVWRDNFWNYRSKFSLLSTFYFYPFEAAFMYCFFHASPLKTNGEKFAKEYETGSSQSSVTGMVSFKKEKLYNTLHFIKTEFRFYPAILKFQGNGFFLSAFCNAGFGVTKQNRSRFLYEGGAGIGYTLFDNVPFTFQVGINQDGKAVFFISLVSFLTHRP